MSNTGVYTIYSYEDEEIKGVFESMRAANMWIHANREGRGDDCRVDYWVVQKGEK